jgi:hypothetical protein
MLNYLLMWYVLKKVAGSLVTLALTALLIRVAYFWLEYHRMPSPELIFNDVQSVYVWLSNAGVFTFVGDSFKKLLQP